MNAKTPALELATLGAGLRSSAGRLTLAVAATLFASALLAGCIQALPFDADTGAEPVDTSEPDASAGDATEPDGQLPDVVEPDGTDPDIVEPDGDDPDVADPDAGETHTGDTTEPCTGVKCPCGDDAPCDGGLTCFDGSCCASDCAGKTCGDDLCGGTCGDCLAGAFCNGFHACALHLCTPDTNYCGSSVLETEMFLYICNSEGSGKLDDQDDQVNCQDNSDKEEQDCIDCEEGDEACWEDHNGGYCGCIPQCTDKECGDDGCGGSCGGCEEKEYCADSACVVQFCTPQSPYCDGDWVHICNEEGSGPSGSGDFLCTQKGDQETCVPDLDDPAKTSCQCIPACDGKECGPDGCDGLCGECPENEFCDEDGEKFGEGGGLCFPTECKPSSPACGIDDPTKLYFCDPDGFVADDVDYFVDCTGEGGGLCKLSYDSNPGFPAEVCNCDQPGQMECNYEETDENDNPISVKICLEDGSWKFEACTGGSSNPLCLAGKCMELCAENNNPCLGDVCSEAKEGEVHCAGGPGSFEGATLVCELGDSATWLWMADSCPDGWTCAWDNNQCQEQGGGGSCGGAFCLDGEICYGDYGQGGDTQDTCHDCGDVCDYLCGTIYGNGGMGSCACVDGQDGSPCDDGISCTNNQCSGAGGAACSSDQSVCAGNPCSAEDDGAKYCAYGPGTNASTYINCDYAEEGWKWVVAWCPDGQGCDTVTNQCKEGSNQGQFCATGGSPCSDQSCEVEGQTLCLDQGKILLCQHIGGANYEWNVLDGCPSGATCTNDSCGSPGGDVVCLEGSANEEQAVSFCGQIKCCEGPGWECAEPASVCATNNDHTILHCNAEFTKPYSEICLLGSVCEGGECVEIGGGGCDACLDVTENTWACIDNQCTDCDLVCSQAGVCGAVVGMNEWGICDCDDDCPEGQECDYAQNACQDAEGCDPVNCGDQTCGITSNLCGEMAFCGAMCGFGQCGDDEAADVIVAENNHIYVVGHSCHYGSVEGCWLTVWELGPGGIMSGTTSIDDYDDWFDGYDDTRATAAALFNGDLFVVGWTRSTGDIDKKRYGFIARFGMGGSSPQLKQLHRETQETVFLDIAMHPSWMGGDAIVVGHSEEYGMGYPSSRHPWAMRYRFPSPSTIEQAPTWNGTSNFGPYGANGFGDTIVGEGMATGVSIITPSSALIVGWLPVDPTINGNSIDPFLVHMKLSNGNFTAGVNLSSLHDTKVFGLRLLQSETLGGAYTAFVMGQRVVESKERPWMAEISFSLEGAQAVPTFNASNDYPQEKLWDMYAGGGALFDACLHPNGHWVLVGQAGNVDTSDVVPFVATVEKGGDDGSIKGAAQLFEQTPLEDFSSLTDDAFQACATTTVAGIPRVIMVGDIQEKGSESGQDDILMVDYYPGLDGPATMQLPCAGMPLQP